MILGFFKGTRFLIVTTFFLKLFHFKQRERRFFFFFNRAGKGFGLRLDAFRGQTLMRCYFDKLYTLEFTGQWLSSLSVIHVLLLSIAEKGSKCEQCRFNNRMVHEEKLYSDTIKGEMVEFYQPASCARSAHMRKEKHFL